MEEKDVGGRPKYEVDYETLDGLCKIFCTGSECASILGVDYHTLNTALLRDGKGGFLHHFEVMSAEGKKSLRRKQFEVAAEQGNVPMLIWMGKQFLKQTDKSEVENTVRSVKLIPPVKPK